jgi:cytoplasmic iron level regulating protein YaaA (DUF328/UPF0246 family)
MFIFIPPSESKAVPSDAGPAALGSLVLPGQLGPTRRAVRASLVRLCRGPERDALGVLGLSTGQAGELAHNRQLAAAPAGAAADVYTGVLYDAFGLPSLRERGVALDHVLIFSGLWGVLRPGDRIPHYRCSAGVKLPDLGSVSTIWRKALRTALAAHVGERLVVDLRSGAYAALWQPGANAVCVRVLHEYEADGRRVRKIISHHNKATKGRLARALVESGQRPGKPGEFVDVLRDLGYQVEPGPEPTSPLSPMTVDVVVSEL